jgi:hypothetical protein
VGYTLASFMLGLPHNSNSSFPWNADAFWSQHFGGLYFQNDWRVTPKLTVNMGLRWDVESAMTERYDRATSLYDPTVASPINAAAQAAYAKILATNTSAPVQALAQLLPASAFQVKGGQLFNGVGGVPRGVGNTRWREFQPRIGFAYKLGPNTVIRGGFGRFVQATFITAGQNGFSRSTSLVTTKDNYLTYYDTLDNPYRDGIFAPTGSSLGLLTNLGQGPSWTNPDAGRPYGMNFSMHLQHQIRSWLFELGYTHNQVYDIVLNQNQNLASFNLWKQLRAPQFDAAGRPVDQLMWDQQVPNPFVGLAGVTGTIATSSTIALNQLLNPVTILGGITRNNNPVGQNQYDALLGKIEHRFSKGFSVINSFTWSKIMEDNSYLGPEIAGRVIEHRLGGEDRPLRLSVAPIWQVPVGRNKQFGSRMPKALDFILGGWQLSGQFTIQSGKPITFDDTDNFFFSGKDFKLPNDRQSLSQWFDTSQFYKFPDKGMTQATLATYPAWTGVQGLPGYNYTPSATDATKNGVYQDFASYVRTIPTRWRDIRSSRVNNVDTIISKTFLVRERVKIQYRFEAYNLFNHVRFGDPASLDPGNSSFGKVNPTQQNNARMVQMALKLSF